MEKRKIGKLILAVCAVLALTACSARGSQGAPDREHKTFSDDNRSGGGSGADAARGPEWVYVPEVVTFGGRRADFGRMELVGDTFCYLNIGSESGEEAKNMCRYSLKDRKLVTADLDWEADGRLWEVAQYTFDRDCNLCLVANVYSADFSELKRFLCKFDPEGSCLFARDVTEQLDRDKDLCDMAVDGQERIYVFTGDKGYWQYNGPDFAGDTSVWMYAEDGSFHGSLPYDTKGKARVKGTVTDGDTLYACISEGENSEHCTLMEVDYERSRLTARIENIPNLKGFCPGTWQAGNPDDAVGDSQGRTGGAPRYDFFLYDDTCVYGYDCAAGKQEELFVWGDSDINGYFVEHFGILEDGRYYCMVEDWIYDDRCVVLLTRTRAEDAPRRENMTLAAVNGGSDIAALAVRFSRSSYQYHITVKDYDSLNDLYNALLAGEAIDIVDLSGVNIEKLSRQGAFEDLSPYLEQSENFDRSSFVDGILEAYTFDGTLVGIPENFALRTVSGDRKWVGGNTGLTLDGLFEAAGQNPGALPFDGITKEEMMQYLCMFNEDAFIDWETGECHFDSAQFKAMLEFVNRFPDVIEEGEEKVSLASKIQNGEILFAIADLNDLNSFQGYVKMFGENAACIGFPTPDGRGGTILYTENAFGILSGSEHKSGAWEFIESVLGRINPDGMERKDVYLLYDVFEKLPVRQKLLDVLIEYRKEEDLEDASKGRFPSIAYEDGWTFTHHAITQDEINVLLDLIPDAKPFFSAEGDEIIRIINEEAGAYYSGQKSAEDVAGVIQNRVGIYVKEHI